MSRKRAKPLKKAARAHSGKRERYIQPSILLGLLERQSYGYELIQTIQAYGFIEGRAAPGMIYRHLRQLEGDGLVVSEWETGGTGPAKRVYRITAEGEQVLDLWIEHMTGQVDKLRHFIARYRSLREPKKA
jgi:poly-beta-hydroxybutyrate-responsive repressor